MANGLIVRSSVRYEISMPSRVRVAPYHAEVLSFAKGVGDGERWVDVDVIDFASGGLGFVSTVFFPRNVDLEVEVLDTRLGEAPPLLRALIRVQRVQMTDRRPAYQVGCSFVDPDDQTTQQINGLLVRMSGEIDAGNGGHTDA